MSLLDFLNSPEAQLGIGLLAAGGPTTDPNRTGFGQRLQGTMQGMDAQKQQALKMKLLQSQIDENASQNMLRASQIEAEKRKQAALLAWRNGGATPGGSGGVVAGVVPSADGGGLMGAAPDDRWSANAIGNLKIDAGVDMVDVAKLARPNWQAVGNTMVNTNDPNYKGGYVPDPTKGVDFSGGRVSLLPGAENLATLAGQTAAAQGRVKPVKEWNPEKQRYDWTNETAVATGDPLTAAVRQTESNGNVNAVSPKGAQGDMQVMPGTNTSPGFGVPAASNGSQAERTRVGEQYLKAMNDRYKNQTLASIAYNWGPGNTDMWLKSGGDYNKLPEETKKYVSAVMTRAAVNGFGGGGNRAAEPSFDEQAQNAVNKEYQTKVAGDQVEQRKTIMNAGFAAPGKIAKLEHIDKLLGDFEGGRLSKTGVEFASAMNSLGIKVDKNLPNKEAAAAMSREIALSLRNPSNGAGMPGAMSDSDRRFLEGMTPDIGQTAQGRKQIINAGISIEQRNQQVATFARKYEDKYGKLDNKFYDQLSAWSSQNQMFGDKK